MCGLIGTFNWNGRTTDRLVGLEHRGPDSNDFYSDDLFFVKHYRLAIIGSEETANQPMLSRNGRFLIAFNGEIYNYKEIAEELGDPTLANDGDTRVLIELLSRDFEAGLQKVNGMFAFSLYDKVKKSLYLVRDRLGIKPLYYTELDEGLVFSSEIKSILSIVSKKVSSSAIENYLNFGIYPSGEETFYNGIRQILPGSFLKFENGKATIHRFFDLKEEYVNQVGQRHSAEQYEVLLEDAIRLRLRSDVPISIHFSGGTDSTALLLKTKEVWGWDFPITAYTMSYAEREFDEFQYTQPYSRDIDVVNKKVVLASREVPDLAEELAHYQDEPYGGIPTIAYFKMNKVQRDEGFIVAIEGQGGDETFGGYRYHILLGAYDLILSGENSSLLESLLRELQVTKNFVVETAERLISMGFLSHTDLTDMKTVTASKEADFVESWLVSIQMYDILQNKIPRTLRFNDRASMGCGREIRFPMLDHRVLLKGLSLSHEIKFGEGMSKAPLRQIIKKYLSSVFSVPKRSVVTPQTHWLQNELRPWAAERIDKLKSSGLVDDGYFSVVEQFYSEENPENSFPVWQLINLSYL